jgi:signal peptidase II
MIKQKIMGIVFFCCLLLGLDILTKIYTHHSITPMAWASPVYPYGGIPVFHNWHGIDFSINYVMNKGAAWGILASMQNYLLYASLLIIGGLFSYLLFCKTSFFKQCALYLILTGAIGNVIDFFVYGHVVDMFHFSFWGYSYPVFNIADASIFCGICLLFFHTFAEKGSKQRSPKEKTS